MRNSKIVLQEETTEVLSLKLKPFKRIKRSCSQLDGLILEGNKLETRNIRSHDSGDIQDDSNLDIEIRRRVHDVRSFSSLNEENIHNLLTEKNDILLSWKEEPSESLNGMFDSKVKDETLNSEGEFTGVKRMQVETAKVENNNKRQLSNQSEFSQLLECQKAKIEKLESVKARIIAFSENLVLKLQSSKSTADSEIVLLNNQISKFKYDEQLKDLDMELRKLKG